MTVLFGAPQAYAAARCLTARSIDKRSITSRHPRPCAWCAMSLEELKALVEGWFDWAKYAERNNTYDHHELRVWQELPEAERDRQTLEAQGLVEPNPVQDRIPTGLTDREPVPLSTEVVEAPAIQEPAPVAQPDEEIAWLPSR